MYHILFKNEGSAYASCITLEAVDAAQALATFMLTNNINDFIAMYQLNEQGYLKF